MSFFLLSYHLFLCCKTVSVVLLFIHSNVLRVTACRPSSIRPNWRSLVLHLFVGSTIWQPWLENHSRFSVLCLDIQSNTFSGKRVRMPLLLLFSHKFLPVDVSLSIDRQPVLAKILAQIVSFARKRTVFHFSSRSLSSCFSFTSLFHPLLFPFVCRSLSQVILQLLCL